MTGTSHKRAWGRMVALAALAAAAFGAPPARAASSLRIEVLSNRADLISGGEALVAIDLPRGTRPRVVHVTLTWRRGQRLHHRIVTRAFALRPDGRYEGLVRGLPLGRSTLIATARRPKRRPASAHMLITDHPNGGPVFSGPQVQPWICQQGAVDRQCDEPPQYQYTYMSTDPTKGFQPYDPKHPPSDVAMTTTDEGVTVPFIVREEIGYEDRDQYVMGMLWQPGQRWAPWAPQHQWNHKLVIGHGGGCGNDFGASGAPAFEGGSVEVPETTVPATQAIYDYALSRGFAMLSTDLDNNGDNCNIVVQAESLLMAKEHFIDTYGPLRYTIGLGCSGGSLTAQQVANAYPGIYQAVAVTCSFPDTWTSATQVSDFHLLNTYFENPSEWGAGVGWTPTQMAAVEGNALPADSIVSDVGFFYAIQPDGDCWPLKNSPATAKLIYNGQSNPGGVRCGIADYTVNVFGRRPPSVWTPQEKQIGHGFAGLALDNTGVEYGLSALQQGLITPAQFVDLNTKLGGLNIDAQVTAKRLAADEPALANAYRSGAINEATNLNQVPIIDLRGPDPGAAHDSYRAFAVRARLDRAHGTHANQVIWEGPTVIVGDGEMLDPALDALDRWLSAIERDHSRWPLAAKVIRDKPADVTDHCSDGAGNVISNSLCPPGVVPVYGTPRTVAGDAITTDTNKCQLKPLQPAGHGLIPFTDPQWAQLKTLFPTGVCDYSKPPISQRPTIPWLTYQTATGKVVYGGRPLGPAPAGSGTGWASSSFSGWLGR